MFTKYGSIGGSLNDSGIYMEDGEPVYALVVLTNGQGNVDEFLATMNLRMNGANSNNKTPKQIRIMLEYY